MVDVVLPLLLSQRNSSAGFEPGAVHVHQEEVLRTLKASWGVP